MKKLTQIIILVFILTAVFSCNKKMSLVNSQVMFNSKEAMEKQYLILISLDGFRWDYADRFKPPNLNEFIKNGVKAESLIPSFPSKTFPNHYTIATGMYPENHGLLGNSYYSYEKNETYSLRKREIVQDGSWYGGTPIWVQAAKAGMVTASYFFVGSEADVQGIRPTYYHNYDGAVKNQARVDQAIEWLELPAEKRPHLITMYFSDMDDIGHRVGPNEDEALKNKLFDLDVILGGLFERAHQTGLAVNIIIVSDHGMTDVPIGNFIPVESIENDDLYLTVDNGAIVNIYPKDMGQTDAIYDTLKLKENHFSVYKIKDTPYFEYVPKNKNWGAIQILPDSSYYFSSIRSIGFRKSSSRNVFGQHGFDPEFKDMHAIFYANGAAFKEGYVTPSVKNIHIYPIMCKILGLQIPKNIDGDINQLNGILADE